MLETNGMGNDKYFRYEVETKSVPKQNERMPKWPSFIFIMASLTTGSPMMESLMSKLVVGGQHTSNFSFGLLDASSRTEEESSRDLQKERKKAKKGWG